MLTLLVALIFIALMAWLGWRQGALRLGSSLLILLAAGLLAKPLAPASSWFVSGFDVPKLVVPLISTLASGLILFVALSIPVAVLIKRKFRAVDTVRPAWDSALGSLAGGVWGCALVILTLTGLSSVARLDRAMRQGVAESSVRQQARSKFEREVEIELRPYRTTMTPKSYAEEKAKMIADAERDYRIDRSEVLKATAQGPMDGFLVDLEDSPFEGVVDKVSPVNEKVESTLRDLTIVMSDSMLTARFLEEPAVKALVNDPVIKDLSKDREIAEAIKAKNYRELMDHPKIVALVEQPEVRAKFSRIDIAEILERVRSHDWRPSVEKFKS